MRRSEYRNFEAKFCGLLQAPLGIGSNIDSSFHSLLFRLLRLFLLPIGKELSFLLLLLLIEFDLDHMLVGVRVISVVNTVD